MALSYDGAVYDGSYPITARTIYEQLMTNTTPVSWAIHFQDFTTAHGIRPLNTYTSHFVEDYNFTTFYAQVANNVRPLQCGWVDLVSRRCPRTRSSCRC